MTATAQHSESLRIEAAMCIWECMVESRWHDPQKGKPRVQPWQIHLDAMWERYGTPTMRDHAAGLIEKALETFDLIGGHDLAEELDLIPYDWEFIPSFVCRVDWENGGCADPKAIAADMLGKLWPTYTAAERLDLARIISVLGYQRSAAEYEIQTRRGDGSDVRP